MSTHERRLLVPVADSVTMRETVAYAVEAATGAPEESDAGRSTVDGEGPAVHFVYVATGRILDPDGAAIVASAEEALERAEVWAKEDRDEGADLAIETAVVGVDQYLFAPGDYADALAGYADDWGLDRVILDPEYDPGGTEPILQPLELELGQRGLAVEEAPVERPARRTALARAATAKKYGVVFVASMGFYLLLGDPTYWFDLATGAVTAAVAALLLGPVAFGSQPSLPQLGRRLVRLAVYAPYLLWEIAKANVQIAYVVLHPSLPIDPDVVELRPAVWGDAAVTTLANSITLTPGTLTVDVSQRAFVIHTLTEGAREDLIDGGLERAVRFVFYGRAAARVPSPRERGDHDAATDEPSENEQAEVTVDD